MNRKYSLLVFGFLAFIQSLFGQKEYDVFLEKPKVTSFKEAKVEAEKSSYLCWIVKLSQGCL